MKFYEMIDTIVEKNIDKDGDVGDSARHCLEQAMKSYWRFKEEARGA